MASEPRHPAGRQEDRISPGIYAEMEQHVAGCPHCTSLCDSLKRTLALCKALPTPEVPGQVQKCLRQAVAAALAESRQ
jgi:RNA polymerase sigma-70 factor (ECF subfamily)